MKKALSLILCAVMMLGCFSIAVSAADPYTITSNFTSSNQLESGTADIPNVYTIPSGVSVAVPSDLTLYIPANAELVVSEGATLTVYGTVSVLKKGELTVRGTLENSSKVICEDGTNDAVAGKATVLVNFAKLADYGLVGRETPITVSYFTSLDPYAEAAVNSGSLAATIVNLTGIEDDEYTAVVNLNETLFIKVAIGEPEPPKDKYDDGAITVFANGIGVAYGNGWHRVKAATSMKITYTAWRNGHDADFYTTKLISLPTGEGYEVIGRDGETADDGAIRVKYGQPFSFRVEIDEAYDMSDYKVYVYNGYGWLKINPNQSDVSEEVEGDGSLLGGFLPIDGVPAAVPDADGFYTINNVNGDITIYVVGVVKNATINMIGNIIETIRNIFNLIKEFFESIFSSFNFGA